MSDNNTTSYSGGVSFTGLLTLIFITLKLLGVAPVATWPWVWVLSPIWISVIIGFAVLAVVLAICYIVSLK